MPLVSVIIPTYNYGQVLPRAVASARAQRQPGLDVEVIVVDDGSTDGTPRVMQGLGPDVCGIRQANAGVSAARNRGLREASGEYLCFLDADDQLTAGVLACQAAYLRAHPDVDISVCQSLQAPDDRPQCYLWQLQGAHLDTQALRRSVAPIHACLLRAAVARDTGGFDTGLRACEDPEFWLRCAAMGKRFGVNAEGLVIYRLHAGSSISRTLRQLRHAALLRERVDRWLNAAPGFPLAGRRAGWLAHAAGTMETALPLHRHDPAQSLRLLQMAARAVLRAEAHASEPAPDAHAALLRRCLAGRFLLLARNVAGAFPDMEAAVLALARRHADLAALDSPALGEGLRRLERGLTCDFAPMLARLARHPDTRAWLDDPAHAAPAV